MEHIKRILQDKIEERLVPGKAVLIYGARRVGKTVLLKEIVKKTDGKTIILNGEDIDVHNMLQNRSVSNFRQLFSGIDLLAIDEALNIPIIGLVIKVIVDDFDGF